MSLDCLVYEPQILHRVSLVRAIFELLAIQALARLCGLTPISSSCDLEKHHIPMQSVLPT